MKIYIATDLESVAGVYTLPEYCLPGPDNKYNRPEGGKHYRRALELATMEVNSAIEGLLEVGVTEILVCDGHGQGGLDSASIRPEARVIEAKRSKYPLGLDTSFDAAIMIGQHAKADTDGGHLCHSGSFSRADWLLNGKSVGEIALFMLLAGYFNVPVIMISGDLAACEEARQLVPSIETVSVIEGQKKGSTKGMTTDEAIDFNAGSLHVSPEKARRMICEGVGLAMKKVSSTEIFRIDPPYEMIRITRPREDGSVCRAVSRADDFIKLLNHPIVYEPF